MMFVTVGQSAIWSLIHFLLVRRHLERRCQMLYVARMPPWECRHALESEIVTVNKYMHGDCRGVPNHRIDYHHLA